MRYINGLLAAFVASAPLALAQCNGSISCTLGAWACTKLCERRGHTAGGVCAPRDGCPGQKICSCYPAKRSEAESIDGDAWLEDNVLGGVNATFGSDVSEEEFVTAFLEEEPTTPEEGEGQVEERDLGKRSLCCGLIAPFAGFCCEQSCYHAGHLEGGQCTNDHVCVCG